MTSRFAVFGYASLVSPTSAASTLGRPVDPLPARLGGWQRRWTQYRDNRLVEKTFERLDGGGVPPFVLGLNLEPCDDAAAAPNGALIEVTETELLRLDVREIRYDRIEVTDALAATDHRFDAVFAYTAKSAHRAAEPPAGAVVIAAYARTVERAFAELGTDHRRLYVETTGPPPVEVVEAVLVRDHIPPGNPRCW